LAFLRRPARLAFEKCTFFLNSDLAQRLQLLASRAHGRLPTRRKQAAKPVQDRHLWESIDKAVSLLLSGVIT
jgi:hypothetical protein